MTAKAVPVPYLIAVTAPFLLAFVALRHIFHELHEFGHMAAGRLYCGVWGTRDFNNVHSIVEQCTISQAGQTVVALAGPIVNYAAIWIGAVYSRAGAQQRNTERNSVRQPQDTLMHF